MWLKGHNDLVSIDITFAVGKLKACYTHQVLPPHVNTRRGLSRWGSDGRLLRKKVLGVGLQIFGFFRRTQVFETWHLIIYLCHMCHGLAMFAHCSPDVFVRSCSNQIPEFWKRLMPTVEMTLCHAVKGFEVGFEAVPGPGSIYIHTKPEFTSCLERSVVRFLWGWASSHNNK